MSKLPELLSCLFSSFMEFSILGDSKLLKLLVNKETDFG